MDARETLMAGRFEQLIRPHLEGMLRFAYRLTHSQADAEDLFQDVLAKLILRIDDIAALDEPKTWLNRVLYNHFIDNRRRYARRRLVDVAEHRLPAGSIESLPGGDTSPADEVENLDTLASALSQLSDEHRTIVLLHDAEGYKLSEIEAATGIPVGTVKSRLHRARARLREILDTDGTI